MQDEIINNAAQLMTEQTAAYASLESLTGQLIGALTLCEPGSIEAFARTGESELYRMRARLLEITSALTGFAEMRAAQIDPVPLDPASREKFEGSVAELLKRARSFEKAARRAESLALGGTSFAMAGIQNCGVPPTTYRAPVLRYSKGVTR